MKRWLAGMLLAMLVHAPEASGFEIESNQQIDGEAPRIVGKGAGNTVVPSGESPDWVYRWGDRDGDGGGVAVSDPGLDLGTYRLYGDHAAGTLVLDLNGGAIEGSGDLAIILDSASLTITNAGAIAAGRIETRAKQGGSSRTAGNIRIGGPGRRVGPLRVGGLDAYASSPRAQRAGLVHVYSSGAVRIEDGTGRPGDIRADTVAGSSGNVVVDHAGALRVGDIRTSTEGGRAYNVTAGNIRLDGGDGSGDAEIGRIIGWDRSGRGRSRYKPLFSIANYRNVTVGTVKGQADRTRHSRYAANLRIREGIAGDIVLTGMLNLGSSRVNAAPRFRGTAELACGGSITLAELDLELVQYLSLESGSGRTVVQGDLLNFETNRLEGCEGTGRPEAPFSADQDTLRAPSGHTVLYNSADGRNVELGGHAYRVADLEGNAGQGGTLIHDPDLPVMHTRPATGIHTTRATLNGLLVAAGSSPATVTVLWGPGADAGADETEWPHRQELGTVAPDTEDPRLLTHELEGLTPGATYAFRFLARNESGTVWGGLELFTAWDVPETPSLSVGGVEWEAAVLHVAFGGTPEPRAALLLQPGRDAGTGAPGDWARTIPLDSEEGLATVTVDGLERGAVYAARVHARNEVGEAWSEPVEFVTLSADPQQLLDAAGITGGLCVHLGSGNGDLAAAIGAHGPFLVNGLDASEENVAQARRRIRQRGLYGPVSVERWTPGRLPYADTMVNLLIVENDFVKDSGGPEFEELWRVLVPRGVAMLKQADEAAVQAALPDADMQTVQVADACWIKVVKPWPDGMDEWRHPHYDPTRSATSRDTHVGPASSLRWIDGPGFARGRKTYPFAAVSASGRFIYMQDKAPPSFKVPDEVYLVARDAFNGVALWRRPVDPPQRRYGSPLPPGTLVAGRERVYAVLEQDRMLKALDAATGRTLRTYGAADHLVVLDKDLVIHDRSTVRRVEKASGEEIWAAEAGHPRGKNELAFGKGRIFVRSQRHGRIRCLRWADGELLWEYGHGHAFSGIHENILILNSGSRKKGVCIETGNELWRSDVGGEGFLADALVWGLEAGNWVGLDPRTGEEKRSFPGKFHNKCAPGRATDRYLITGRTDFFDVRSGERHSPHIARGTCRYPGVIPANGLIYAFPTACICYPMLHANVAMSPVPVARDADPAAALEKGPAWNKLPEPAQASRAPDWPMFRYDARRSGASPADIPSNVSLSWSVAIAANEPISPPVFAGGRVFVSAPNAHEVHALDAETGQSLWMFTADGRVPHPPTITHGVCVFGSEDGFVYALNPEDGRLAWRHRVAPGTGRIFAYGSLASAWPVLGSVLADGDRVLAVAGRHGPLDGGARAVALDPRSGRLLWETDLEGANRIDMLVKGDKDVFMWNDRIHAETGEYSPRRGRGGRGLPALFAGATLLNNAWAVRSRWNMGKVSASLLVFNKKGVFGIDPFPNNTACRPGHDDFRLLFRPTGEGEPWDRPLPAQLRALVLAGQTLFAAGPPDTWPTQGGLLYALEAGSGEVMMETELDATPLQDGLIAANGRLFMATEEGLLIGFAVMH